MLTKHEAKLGAQKALSQIKNRRHWKICLHENLGWHWCLESIGGFFTLSGGYNGESRYSCLLSSSSHQHAGDTDWTDDKRFTDPNKTIAHTLRLATARLKSMTERINLAKQVLTP